MKVKSFLIEGFGEVGIGNLSLGHFVVTKGKDWRDLEIGESCAGILKNPMTGGQGKKQSRELIRLTRVEDKEAI